MKLIQVLALGLIAAALASCASRQPSSATSVPMTSTTSGYVSAPK